MIAFECLRYYLGFCYFTNFTNSTLFWILNMVNYHLFSCLCFVVIIFKKKRSKKVRGLLSLM